jgi:hypothetical protein
MEVLRSSEMLVLTRATWYNIPEHSILHSHCHENLKSNINKASSTIQHLERCAHAGAHTIVYMHAQSDELHSKYIFLYSESSKSLSQSKSKVLILSSFQLSSSCYIIFT